MLSLPGIAKFEISYLPYPALITDCLRAWNSSYTASSSPYLRSHNPSLRCVVCWICWLYRSLPGNNSNVYNDIPSAMPLRINFWKKCRLSASRNILCHCASVFRLPKAMKSRLYMLLICFMLRNFLRKSQIAGNEYSLPDSCKTSSSNVWIPILRLILPKV